MFSGLDAAGNTGLWETDGTVAGTFELTGISGAYTGAGGLDPSDLTAFNGEVLFSGHDESGQRDLWVSNGTVAGTFELSGISGANAGGIFDGLNGPYPDLTVFNGEVLFKGDNAAGNTGLWATNGTAAGTFELTGINGANAFGLSPSDLTVFNGEVLFSGLDAAGQRGLWVTDGTAAGTFELAGISGASTLPGLYPSDLTVFNGEVLFSGLDAAGNNGLWVTDGTVAGTHELTGISGTTDSWGLNPYDLTVYDGEMLFQGFGASGQRGLWVTDGTVAGTFELASGVVPYDLTVFNGKVLFDSLYGLWETDGTVAGTFELTGISGANTGGIFYPYIPDLTVSNGQVCSRAAIRPANMASG
jgi:ELWxxDGT repeat protein